jgi:hypothetical protein
MTTTDEDAAGRPEFEAPWAGRHPSTQHFAPLFEFAHLPIGKLRVTSADCAVFAALMVDALPDGPELSAGLRKLLEAKDCFVRAAVLQARRGTLNHPGSDRWTGGDRKDAP